MLFALNRFHFCNDEWFYAVGHNNTKILPSLVCQKVRRSRPRESTTATRMGIARGIEQGPGEGKPNPERI